MPSVNVLRNVNLATERRGGGGCPNTAKNPLGCGTPELTYTALSLDEVNQKWYPTNSDGFYTPDTGSAGTITGSASLISIVQNGCPYPAIAFSGSLTVPLSALGVQIGIVTGSFELSGVTAPSNNWRLTSQYYGTGSAILQVGSGAPNYVFGDFTSKNTIVGFLVRGTTSPFGERDVTLKASGSIVSDTLSTNTGFAYSLGDTLTLRGEGIIRSFGWAEGTLSQQTQFNCLYGSTPSK